MTISTSVAPSQTTIVNWNGANVENKSISVGIFVDEADPAPTVKWTLPNGIFIQQVNVVKFQIFQFLIFLNLICDNQTFYKLAINNVVS